jgi:hypothetical protein
LQKIILYFQILFHFFFFFEKTLILNS